MDPSYSTANTFLLIYFLIFVAQDFVFFSYSYSSSGLYVYHHFLHLKAVDSALQVDKIFKLKS